MKLRDLEAVRQIISAATGLEVSYAYDDLVFPENTVFIIQFDDEDLDHLYCHFQEDCEVPARENVLQALRKECEKRDCKITYSGTYVLDMKDENLDIKFTPVS